jgi:hypothetical protein
MLNMLLVCWNDCNVYQPLAVLLPRRLGLSSICISITMNIKFDCQLKFVSELPFLSVPQLLTDTIFLCAGS